MFKEMRNIVNNTVFGKIKQKKMKELKVTSSEK